MKIKRFLINGVCLTLASLITQALGMIFRIYMSSCIGAEAIGLYQLILTVYFFAVTASTSGMTLLVTRLVTEAMALNKQYRIKSIVFKCTLAALSTSTMTALLLFYGSDFISENILKQSGTAISIRILSPSLPFIAISACIRGYFYARRQAIKPAGEQLLEQITEMGVFALLVGTLAPKGIEYACGAVAIGATISEAITALYSIILYRLDIRKLKVKSRSFPVKKHLYFIALPVMMSSCLRSGLNIIENATIPRGLEKYGNSKSEALSNYGLISGMVMPLLSFPSVVIFSFASIIIPELSEVYAKTDKKQIQKIASNTIRTVFCFSIPIAVLFFFFGKEIGLLVYNSDIAGRYLSMFAVAIPIMYLDSVVDSMLKGLNEQFHYLSYNILDSMIRVIMVIILIPRFGMSGLIITTYTGAIFNTGLSLLRLIKVTEIKIKFLWIFVPLIIAVTFSLFLKLIIN